MFMKILNYNCVSRLQFFQYSEIYDPHGQNEPVSYLFDYSSVMPSLQIGFNQITS